MVDPGALPALGGGAAAAAYGLHALNRVIGPSLSKLGEVGGRWIDFRTQNVGRMGEKAARKAGAALQVEGSVPPRVAAHLLDDASYCDDDVMLEYFAGVLASSRTPGGRDDRGAKWAAVVARMSSFEVRTHYLVYRTLREALVGQDIDLSIGAVLGASGVYLPLSGYVVAMGLTEEDPSFELVSDHAITGLARESLISGDQWLTDPSGRDVVAAVEGASEGGVVAYASHAGLELYLWAHGYGMRNYTAMLDAELDFALAEEPPAVAGARITKVNWNALSGP